MPSCPKNTVPSSHRPIQRRRTKLFLPILVVGQVIGVEEVEEGIWLVSIMHHDLGYIDLEEKTLQPLENSFGPHDSPAPVFPYSPMMQVSDETETSNAREQLAKG